MLENTTNLANTTVWVDVIKSYINPILLGILILVTIMLFYFGTKIDRKYKHIERIQQEYAELLKPSAVKLEHDRHDSLKHSNQDDLYFDDFMDEVKRQRKYRKLKVEDSYKKAEEAVKEYRSSFKLAYEGIKTISINVFKKEGFGSIIWNGEGNKPLGDYINPERIPLPIENIINGHPLKIEEPRGDGRYMLQCPDTMAKTTSKDKAEKLKELIEYVARDYEVKELITKRDEAKKEIDKALKDYNDRFVKVIYDLRMYPHRRLF